MAIGVPAEMRTLVAAGDNNGSRRGMQGELG